MLKVILQLQNISRSVVSNMYCMSLIYLQGKGAGRSTGVLEEGHANQEIFKTNSSEPKVSPGTKRPGGDVKEGRGGGKKAKKKETKDKPEEEAEKATQTREHIRKVQKRCSASSKVCYKEETDSEEEGEEFHDDEEYQVTSEEDTEEAESEAKTTKSNKGKGKSKDKGINNKKTASERRSGGGKKTVKDGDRQWEEEEGISSNRTKRRSGVKKEGSGADEWLEVYLEKTSSWICVDVDHGVGMPHLCAQSATSPLTYVVSVDGDGSLKDLGRKYDPTWMTSTRKRRVDEDWWEETLEPFLGTEDERDIKEDKEVHTTATHTPFTTRTVGA